MDCQPELIPPSNLCCFSPFAGHSLRFATVEIPAPSGNTRVICITWNQIQSLTQPSFCDKRPNSSLSDDQKELECSACPMISILLCTDVLTHAMLVTSSLGASVLRGTDVIDVRAIDSIDFWLWARN